MDELTREGKHPYYVGKNVILTDEGLPHKSVWEHLTQSVLEHFPMGYKDDLEMGTSREHPFATLLARVFQVSSDKDLNDCVLKVADRENIPVENSDGDNPVELGDGNENPVWNDDYSPTETERQLRDRVWVAFSYKLDEWEIPNMRRHPLSPFMNLMFKKCPKEELYKLVQTVAPRMFGNNR